MENDSHLYILWTTDNPITAQDMVFMYAGNSLLKGWWDNVTIIIWGASVELVSADAGIREKIQELISMGVEFTACKRCADNLGATVLLESQGIDVRYWGESLTGLLRSGASLLTV